MNLTKQQIINYLQDDSAEKMLLQKANEIRQQNVGDNVHLRGLIEFSNICRNNCMYCGIRKDNSNVCRYRLDDGEIIDTARKASEVGFKTIVMQSGEDMYFNSLRMCHIIEEIKKFDVAITLSIGERNYQDYKDFYEAGANRYLIRIETTDKDLYHKLDPQMSWQNRYECLLALKEIGYEVGSGIMVGLPEQSMESIADDLLWLQKFAVDMAGIGPFIPNAQTPLAKCVGGSLPLALRSMAVMRLLLPDINIPATTAIEALHPNGRIIALQSGANVVMPNVTDLEHRRLYKLYPNANKSENSILQSYTEISQKIISIGRIVGKDYGNHLKK